ncbi:MAG TPA: DUF4168 domain-containing protein [Thiopseudomonas sp.]|nr:DUF4168 domain-containing protein [Thiopseudomonas sp.]
MFDIKKLVVAVSFVTLGLSTSAVMAQNSAPAATNGVPAQQQEQSAVSDAELKKFINANIEVSRVREEYAERFNNAKDQAIAQNLQEEAQEKMLGAVEESGLDATTYNTLSEHVQSSPELQQRIQKLQ